MVDALTILQRSSRQRSDVIDFFAERGSENKALRQQLQQSEIHQKTLQANVQLLKTELQDLQVSRCACSVQYVHGLCTVMQRGLERKSF